MAARNASPAIRELRGMVALVTGGFSGLGKATVERLLRGGVNVVVGDLPNGPTAPDSVMPSYKQLGNCEYSPLDVTSPEMAQQTLSICKKNFGRLDILVNCAGIGIATRTYNLNKGISHPLEDFQRVLAVNTGGTFNMIRLAVALMCENKPSPDNQRGIIVNTASIAAFDGQKGQAAYAASKGAIVSMTLPIARDLADYGIRCVTIAPGLFATPLLQKLPDKVRDLLGKTIPNPARLGHPDEFAHIVQSVIENSYINGEVIRLDGALRMMP